MGNRTGIIKQAAARIGCSPEEWERNTESGSVWCYCCRDWLPRAAFGTDKSRGNGLASACKACVSHKGTASRYGISVEEARRLRSGDVTCEICGRERKLEVDHDHDTGKVRGVLCSRCNGALGQFCDNIDLLEKAIAYLRGKH